MTQKLTGKKEIAEFMQWSVSKLKTHQKEMLENGFLWTDLVGRPPSKRICAWTSELIRWTILKGNKKI